MTEFDSLIVNFKNNMALTATWLNADDQTDIQTASGSLPSLAKVIRTSTEQLNMLVPDISNRLRVDADGKYSPLQQAMGRYNLGLDRVDNTPDLEKPLSAQQQQALQNALDTANSKEDPANRNVVGGYFAYSGAKLPIRNGADTVFGYIFFNGTASRNWQLPDASGTFALKTDITGNNSGTNTGDETTATIKAKLNITTLSGANTGDETQATILNKLNIPSIAGTNTGDETRDSLIGKIGFEVMPLGARNAVSGVAPLDENRLIPIANLPPAFESIAIVDNFGVMPRPGVDKRLYVTVAETGLYYWIGGAYVQLNSALNNTDNLGEGQQNLYFTQLRAIQSILSTFSVGTNTSVGSGDSVVSAIGKLQGQINAAVQDISNKYGNTVKIDSNSLPLSYASEISATLTTTTTATNQVVDGMDAGQFRSVKYLLQISANGTHQVCEVLLIHDGATVSMVEYANVYTASPLASFDADIIGTTLRLLVTPVNANTVLRVVRKAIAL